MLARNNKKKRAFQFQVEEQQPVGKQVSRPGMRYSRWSRAACGSRDPTSQGSSTASSLPSHHQLSVAATTQPDMTRLMKAVPAASANPERASRVREAGHL